MKYKLTIHGRMTSMNDYIHAERTNKHMAADIKRTETARVRWEALAQKLPVFTNKVHVNYRFFVDNARGDEDNLFIYIKFINDGLVLAKRIKGDGRKYLHITGTEFPPVGTSCKTEVEIEEE